jgi:hypothetical protein
MKKNCAPVARWWRIIGLGERHVQINKPFIWVVISRAELHWRAVLSRLRLFLLLVISALPFWAAIASDADGDSYQMTFNSKYPSPFTSDWIDVWRKGEKHIYFDIRIDGQKVTALLDTGASESMIDLDLAKRLGLKQVREASVADINGVKATQPVFGNSLIVAGNRSVVGARLWGADLSGLRQNGFGAEFIIGMDILQAGGLILDLSNHRMRFVESGIALDNADTTLPLELSTDGKKVGVKVKLDTLPEQILFLDTGKDGGVLLREEKFLAVTSGRPTSTLLTNGLNSSALQAVAMIKESSLNGIAIRNMLVSAMVKNGNDPHAEYNGILGIGVVGQYDSSFDFRAGTWSIKSRKSYLPPDPRTAIGLQVLPSDNGLKIEHVMPGSPAERAGLVVGDQICMIDGKDALQDFSERMVLRVSQAVPGLNKTYQLCSGKVHQLVTAEFY